MSEEKKSLPERIAEMQEYYRSSYVNTSPKLDLKTQCQVYACLYMRAPPAIVRNAFSLSRTTVSYIGGCRDDNRKPTELEQDSGLIDPKTKLPIIYHEHVGAAVLGGRDPKRKRRYPHVADEFYRLGEAEFLRAYFTNDVQEKLSRARHEFNTDPKTKRFYLKD